VQAEQRRQNKYAAVSRLNVGRMNDRTNQQTSGIGEQLPVQKAALAKRKVKAVLLNKDLDQTSYAA
jgi:hypothetical protein